MAELKALAALEVVTDKGTFTFTVPNGVPFGEAYDACHEILEKLIEIQGKAVEQMKRPSDSKETVTPEAVAPEVVS